MEGRSWKIGVMAEARHADAFNEDGCARDECTRAERRRHEGAKRTTESQHSGFAASRVRLWRRRSQRGTCAADGEGEGWKLMRRAGERVWWIGVEGEKLSPHLLSFSHLSPNPVCEIQDVYLHPFLRFSTFFSFSLLLQNFYLNLPLPLLLSKKKRDILRLYICIYICVKKETKRKMDNIGER